MATTLHSNLLKTGLSDSEAAVFAVMLSQSPVSATYIAKTLGWSRSSVYTVLASLMKKGLVSETYKNNVKQFESQGYEALEQLHNLEEKAWQDRNQALTELKELIALYEHKDALVPQVMLFEGQEGLKRIYLDMLRQAPPNAVMKIVRDEFVWSKEWDFIFEEEWSARVKKWKQEKNITTQLLINPSSLEQEQVTYYRNRPYTEVKYLAPEAQVTSFVQYILGDTVSVLSLDKQNLVGIKITNALLAENYSQLFNTLWQQARPLT